MVKKILQGLNPEWLAERTILLAATGSYAYGTNTENSDRDYKGICIPPIDYFLGLEFFNEYNSSGGKNFKNTKDDIDVTITHLTKFVKDALKGVPNNIELLFIQPEQYLILTELGQLLIDHRRQFLSKQIFKKFSGYAFSQKKLLEKSKINNTGNNYVYDTKTFMHTVRLLTSAIEILETGDFQTLRPNHDELMDCRNGRYSFPEALSMINFYDEKLKLSYENSTLPNQPDEELINSLLIELNKAGLKL